mmetsp:Transcript_20596/g.64355  ORF Transcript_20596/g.64355 Transcript_20596/m.64355 type:complete len:394 (+) Transcript_20596:252-1433(+)
MTASTPRSGGGGAGADPPSASRAAAAWRGSRSSCPGRQRLDGIEVEGHRVRALQLSVAVDADEALRLLVKVVLERDDDELELALVGARADELCDACHVDVVERSVNLVHHEEGRRAVVVHRKQQRQRRQRALAAGELLHVAEALGGRHGGELDAVQVRLGRVLEREEGGAAQRHALDLGQLLVDVVDHLGDVREARHEALHPLCLHGGEALRDGPRSRPRRVPLALDGVQPLLHLLELLDRLHVRRHPLDLASHTQQLRRRPRLVELGRLPRQRREVDPQRLLLLLPGWLSLRAALDRPRPNQARWRKRLAHKQVCPRGARRSRRRRKRARERGVRPFGLAQVEEMDASARLRHHEMVRLRVVRPDRDTLRVQGYGAGEVGCAFAERQEAALA